MSYASLADSDAYVFLHIGRFYECSDCLLQERHHYLEPATGAVSEREEADVPVTTFTSTKDILAHLDAHRAAGHLISPTTYAALIRDEEANDAWIAGRTKSTPPSLSSH